MSGMRHANLHYSHPDSYLFCLCWCCHQQTEDARFSTEIIGSIPVGGNTNRGADFTVGKRKSPRLQAVCAVLITKLFSNFPSLSFQNPSFFAYLVWFAEC